MKRIIFILITASLSTFIYAQWQKTGPFSDSILIGSIVHNANNIYIGTNKGVYISTDNTKSWQLVNNGLPSSSSHISLALSGDSLFAGTDSGVYITTNNGNLWNIVNTGISVGNPVTTIKISRNYNGAGKNIFVGTQSGLYTFFNNSWGQGNTGLPSNATITSITISGIMRFITTSYFNGDPLDGPSTLSGVYSSDSPDVMVWATSDNGLPLSTMLGSSIPYILLNGANLFTATYGGVYLSTNNGESWTIANKGLPPIRNFTYYKYHYVNTLATSGNYVFAGTSNNPYWEFGPDTTNNPSGVYFSTNNGSSWTAINNGFANNIGINAIDIVGNYILAGTTNGLYVYPNITKSITVSSNALSIGAPVNSSQTFNITSDTSWVISNTQTWITPNVTTGKNNSAITLTARANPTVNQRIDTLTVTGKDLSSQNIVVTQSAGIPTLSVSTNNISLDALAINPATFSINSNTNWLIQSSQNWLTPNIIKGSDSAIVTLTAMYNNSLKSRTDTITISGNGVNSKEVTITQPAVQYIPTFYDTIIITKTINDTLKGLKTITDTLKVIQTVYDTIKITKTINDTILTSVEDTLKFNVFVGSSINSLVSIDQIKVYPNPTGSVLNINTGNYLDLKNYQLKIINSKGEIVWTTIVSQQIYTIDSGLFGSAGLYFLQIYDSDSNLIEVKKIVILKFTQAI